MAKYNRYKKRAQPEIKKQVELNLDRDEFDGEKLSPAMISFLKQENQQSLHRLNNKQRSEDVVSKNLIRLNGYKNLSFTESIKIGYFTTEKKRNFDYSIIISNDPERKQWYMINFTYSEINWICKNLTIPVMVNVNYDDLMIHLFQKNSELLMTFKNSNKNYSHIKFNYIWLGMHDIMIEEPKFDDWILFYT